MEFPRKTVNPSQKNWVKHISFGLHHIFACVAKWGFVRNFCRVRNFDHFRNSDPSFSKLVDPGGFQKFTYIVGEILKNAYFGGFKNFEKLGFEFPARSKFRSRQKFRTKSHFSTHTKIWCKPTKICFIQFFGKDWHFFEGTPFFRGGRGAKFSIFSKQNSRSWSLAFSNVFRGSEISAVLEISTLPDIQKRAFLQNPYYIQSIDSVMLKTWIKSWVFEESRNQHVFFGKKLCRWKM